MPDACPKCGAACKGGQTACTRCGLAVDRMDTFASDRDTNVPDVLGAAWEHALAGWDEQARHDEVMRLVSQHDAYAWAAARYRTRTDPVGERGLARVRKAAEATLMASAAMRKDTAPRPYRALTTIMIMLIVAAGAGLLWATVMSRDPVAPASDNATPAPGVPQIPRQPPPQKVR